MHQYDENAIAGLLTRINPDEEVVNEFFLGRSEHSGNFYRKILECYIGKFFYVHIFYYYLINGEETHLYTIRKKFTRQEFKSTYYSFWKIDVNMLVAELFGRGDGGYSVTPLN